jgi:hypothetical protein
MATGDSASALLDGDRLAELVGLLEGADSVELKLTVPLSEQRSAAQALDIDPLDARVRLITFFDTPDLALNRHGIVLRARRMQDKGEDSVVKLRPVVPDELSPELRSAPGFTVEIDAMPGGFVCSGTLKRERPSLGVDAVTRGEQPLSSLFGKRQRKLLAEHVPAGVELDDLIALGPIFALKLKSVDPGSGRKLVVELWLYPDGSRILELSTKCLPSEAFDVAARTRVQLEQRGISLGGEQQTKTKRALEHFAAQAR